MAESLARVLGHEQLQFRFGFFMLRMRRSRSREAYRVLSSGI
jgi:hypothetical protein